MTRDDFKVGDEFWCGGRRWRCTDVGARVIVAICLDPHEVVVVNTSENGKPTEQQRIVAGDPSWFNGPPYAVSEEVFDEEDIVACTRLPEQHKP